MARLSVSKMACIVSVFCAATAIVSPATTFKTLVNFDGTNGMNPNPLVQGLDGNLYGTALRGGVYGDGTVFKMTPGGTLTTLYSFCAQSILECPDGSNPYAGLVQASNGDIYGTTVYGGDHGDGTVFKITTGGTFTALYSFGGADGANPYAGLVQGTDGNLYGTTVHGGVNGYGAVFKITPAGTLTTLHSFDITDGDSPYAGLIQANNGNFYGATQGGGSAVGGTFFRITSGGTLTTLYNFCAACTDPTYP